MTNTSACCRIEPLESRIAPALLDVTGGAVFFSGGSAADVVAITVSGANYTFNDTAETITLTANAMAAGFSGSGTNTVSGPNTAVNVLVLQLGAGNDALTLSGLTDPIIADGQADTDIVTITGALTLGNGLALTAETINVNAAIAGATTVTLTADTMEISAAVGASGRVILQPQTASRPICLGTENGAALSLTGAELDRFTTGDVLQVGSTAAGAISIGAAISPAGADTLTLLTNSTITQTAALTVGNLRVSAAAAVTLTGANDVDNLAAQVTNSGQNLAFTDADGFAVATVDGFAGLSAPPATAIILNAGPLTQNPGANVGAGFLSLAGAGPFTLTNPGNDVATLSANITGELHYADANQLFVGDNGVFNGIVTTNDDVSLTTIDGNLQILDARTGADIAAGSGKIALTALSAPGQARTLTLDGNAGLSGSGGVTLVADNMSLGAAVNAGPGIVLLKPYASGRAIDLGTETAGTLALTDTELDRITAGLLVIGVDSVSMINVSAALSRAGTGILGLVGATISGAGSIAAANLGVLASDSVTLNGANDVDVFAGKILTSSQTLSFTDADGFMIGTIDTIAGISTPAGGTVVLNGGAMTQAAGANIVTSFLSLQGAGPFDLENLGNDVATIGANVTGSIIYLDANALSIGTAGVTSGIFSNNKVVHLETLDGDLIVTDQRPGADVDAGTSSVTLFAGSAAGQNRLLDIQMNAGVSGATGVTLFANTMTIAAAVNAGTAVVTLAAFTAEPQMNLGTATGGLDLSDAELDHITARVLRLTSSGLSPINVSSAISPANVGTLTLNGSTISGAGSVSVAKLAAVAAGAITLNGANDVDTLAVTVGGSFSFADADGLTLGPVDGEPGLRSIGPDPAAIVAGMNTVAFASNATFMVNLDGLTPGTQHDQLAVTGAVALGGTLQVVAGFLAADQDTFVILDNDGTADAITGTFAALPQGAIVAGGSRYFAIDYAGGDGNDVELTALVPVVTPGSNGKSVTYTDGDGDLVMVKTTSKLGVFTGAEFTLIPVAGAIGGSVLGQIDLGTAFAGSGLAITATRGPLGGNGFANVGYLKATGVDLAAVSIAGDLGRIDAGAVKSLTVQSLGALGLTTQIGTGNLVSHFTGALGKLTVKSSIRGATLLGSTTIGVVNVLGSFLGGQLSAGADLGAVSVRGDIIGTALAPVVISAFGKALAPAKGVDLAIKSLKVGGDVEFFRLLAGYDLALVGQNADASIGAITVGADWRASTVLAGVSAGLDGLAGTADDVKLAPATRDNTTAPIFSQIASITIKGQAFGTTTFGDSFGIVAEQIGKAKLGSVTLPFQKGAHTPTDAFLAGATADFAIREIV